MTQIIEFPNNRKHSKFETPFLAPAPFSINILDIQLSGELARRIYVKSLRLGKRPEAFVVDGLHALMGIDGDAS